MKLRFIFNPRSGHIRRDPALPERLRAFIARHHLDAAIACTEAPHHATELARTAIAEGCNIVVAVGGDGTVNEVAQALVGTPAALGLVPLGSGNGLARDLGLPLHPEMALATLLHGQPRMIDAGYANGRPFFCTMGTGFDADLVERFNRSARRGFATYIILAARHWWRYRADTFIVHTDVEQFELQAFLVAVANAAQFGNNARIAPNARLDDGLLDLVAIPQVTFIRALPLVWRLFSGTLDRVPSIRRLRGTHFKIERTKPGLFHADGEVGPPAAKIDVSIQSACLRTIVPAKSWPRQSAMNH